MKQTHQYVLEINQFEGFVHWDWIVEQGGVTFYTDPLAADDSKPDSDNIRIMIMTKVTPHPNLIGSKK